MNIVYLYTAFLKRSLAIDAELGRKLVKRLDDDPQCITIFEKRVRNAEAYPVQNKKYVQEVSSEKQVVRRFHEKILSLTWLR